MIGRQNLQEYKGWKGGEAEIEEEYRKNREMGIRLNSWKGGMLVYDDDGKVLSEIRMNKKLKKSKDVAIKISSASTL